MNDSISRQDAIDALKKISFSHWFECGEYLSEDTREIEIINSNKALEAIEALPSAQPEIIYCGECKHMMPNGKCRQFADSTIRPSASDFCSAGERKDNG